MSILERMTKGKAFDFSALMNGVAGVKRGFDERMAAINRKYHQWHQAEMEAGRTIETTPPPEVQAAVKKETEGRLAASRNFFSQQERAIRSELEARVADVSAKYEAAATAMEDLRLFQSGVAQLAAECRVAIPQRVDDDLLSPSSFYAWDARARRTLHPPAAPVRRTAAENRLTLPV